jgi:hypothetical protein
MEQEAHRAHLAAEQCRAQKDSTGYQLYSQEADRKDAEVAALLRPNHEVVIGTGREAIQAEPENLVTDLLLKDPTMVALDASEKRLELLEGVDSVALALDGSDSIKARNSFEKMLAHQMAAVHTVAMELLVEAKIMRKNSGSYNAEILALKKRNLARSFMDVYTRQMEVLARMRSGGRQNITVTHKNVNVSGGQAIVADHVIAGGSKGDRHEK